MRLARRMGCVQGVPCACSLRCSAAAVCSQEWSCVCRRAAAWQHLDHPQHTGAGALKADGGILGRRFTACPAHGPAGAAHLLVQQGAGVPPRPEHVATPVHEQHQRRARGDQLRRRPACTWGLPRALHLQSPGRWWDRQCLTAVLLNVQLNMRLRHHSCGACQLRAQILRGVHSMHQGREGHLRICCTTSSSELAWSLILRQPSYSWLNLLCSTLRSRGALSPARGGGQRVSRWWWAAGRTRTEPAVQGWVHQFWAGCSTQCRAVPQEAGGADRQASAVRQVARISRTSGKQAAQLAAAGGGRLTGRPRAGAPWSGCCPGAR